MYDLFKLSRLLDSRLAGNVLSLSVLQGLNYILPLLTIPYLVNVLGIGKFGVLAFALAVVGYLGVVVEYGFNLSATKNVSEVRTDRAKLSDIFTHVLLIKIVLLVICFLVLQFAILASEELSEYELIFNLTFLIISL